MQSHAQVVIRWHVQRGTIVIPKSTIPAELKQNIDVFDFALADDDMAQIEALENGLRLNARDWDAHHPHFPYNQPGSIF